MNDDLSANERTHLKITCRARERFIIRSMTADTYARARARWSTARWFDSEDKHTWPDPTRRALLCSRSNV